MTGAENDKTFRTAIVPAAGLGTRFLPTTKAVPKELLPVVDTPGIELVAAEAAEAGAARLVVVTSPGKESVVEYFRPAPELEAALSAKGKDALLERVRRAPGLLDVEVAIQHEALGGHRADCRVEHHHRPERRRAANIIDPGCFTKRGHETTLTT
jgi:UTP--glucose-1-phosphate uridylyltransferase